MIGGRQNDRYEACGRDNKTISNIDACRNVLPGMQSEQSATEKQESEFPCAFCSLRVLFFNLQMFILSGLSHVREGAKHPTRGVSKTQKEAGNI